MLSRRRVSNKRRHEKSMPAFNKRTRNLVNRCQIRIKASEKLLEIKSRMCTQEKCSKNEEPLLLKITCT